MIIKVAGHKYKVIFKDVDWQHTTGTHGSCDCSALKIYVTDNDRKLETLIHEIGHAIYYEYSLSHVKEEEPIVSLFCSGWHQVLRDNPKLRELLL